MTYKLKNKTDGITGITSEDNVIIRIADNAAIPKDEGNKDYQEYLEWVAEGNTPDPAD
jgi:hypothetical protein|tara:strand:+ start:622 stop:795 length:174 start_codon:yes stop_codon:yes gene_type:complete